MREKVLGREWTYPLFGQLVGKWKSHDKAQAKSLDDRFGRLRIVPAINRGEQGVSELVTLSRSLVTMSQQRPEDLDAILSTALDDLVCISRCILALVSEEAAELGSGMAHVTAITDSTKGSAKNLVKLAIAQCPWWKRKETNYRNFDLATRTLLPKLESLQAKLSNREQGSIKEAVDMMPKFVDQLRPGASTHIEAELRQAVNEVLAQESKSDEATAVLQELRETLGAACLTFPASLREWYQQASGRCDECLRSRSLQKSVTEASAVLEAFHKEDLHVNHFSWAQRAAFRLQSQTENANVHASCFGLGLRVL